MAQLLIKANITSEPLLKIQAITEVSYMSEKHKDQIDFALVECASQVSTSLMNTEKSNITPRSNPHLIRCSWSFKQTEENYKKYVEPWHLIDLTYYPLYTRFVYDHYPDFPPICNAFYLDDKQRWEETHDEILEKVDNWFKKLVKGKAFYQQTYALSRLSFADLKGEFECWATAQLRPIQALVAEEIDPEIYKDVVQLLMKQGRKEEEGAASESRLDT